MDNLLNHAFALVLTLVLIYVVYHMSKDLKLPKTALGWFLDSIYWLGAVLLGTFALTGLITGGHVQTSLATFLFAIISITSLITIGYRTKRV